ncbi:MAG: outer membrane beta-barrel protein [Treponemataceae bacterium]|nr:outer membrane beta-barrel protein [Treponemataceae bacterium]
MKKVVVLAAMAAVFASLSFAEMSMELGVKGGILLNAGTKLDYSGADSKMTVGGDVGIFGHFGVADIGPGTLSLQPELFFSLANGTKWKASEGEYEAEVKYKYNSFDIALLIGYDIPVGKLSIRPFLGPKLGIPLGKIKEDYKSKGYGESYSGSSEADIAAATFGMDFGCGIVVPLGKFVLGGDIRYGIDFNKLKIKTKDKNDKDKNVDILRRGALGINITAAYKFK